MGGSALDERHHDGQLNGPLSAVRIDDEARNFVE
jgi:hypothetical protein